MNIGVLNATLGIDSSAAIKSMNNFQKMMFTVVNNIDNTLSRMEGSMMGVTRASNTMGTAAAANMNKIVVVSKLATVATDQYKNSVIAANAAVAASPIPAAGKIGGAAVSAISATQISNVVAEKTAISSAADKYKVTPSVITAAVGQNIAEAKRVAQSNANRIKEAYAEADAASKRIQSFTKMQTQAIAEDRKRTAILNANRIKEAYAEADAATKRIRSFNKVHTQAIAEDNRRTAQIIANRKKEEAASAGAMGRASAAISTESQKLRTFGYLTTAMVTLPMIMAGKSMFTLAKDYEFAVQKIVGLTGVAQGTVNKWSAELLKMAPLVAKGPQELVDALYFISSSGIKGAESMNVLKLSAQAAAAGLGETKDVADILTSALNAYAGTGKTAAYYTDVLVAAVRVGKAEATSFSSAIGQLIPFAAEAGVSFDQIAGGMAAITLTGSSATNAAVYLKGVFNALIQAGKQGGVALDSVGLKYADLRKILAEGPEGLINVMQKFRDVQMVLGDEAVKDILPNIRTLNAFMSIAGKNFAYNTKIMREVTNAGGSLSAALFAVSNTIKWRYDSAIAQAQVSMISLGSTLATSFLPLLEKLVKKLEELTTWFNSLTAEQKKHKIEWLAFIALLGPATLILSAIGYTISGLISILGGLWATLKYGRLIIMAFYGSMTALNKASAMNATLTAALCNPWIYAAAAIIAATVALTKYIKSLGEIQSTELVGLPAKVVQLRDDKDIGQRSIESRMKMMPSMNVDQLDKLKNDIQTRIQLENDFNLELLTTQQEGLKDTEDILKQRAIIEEAYKASDAVLKDSTKTQAVKNLWLDIYAKKIFEAEEAIRNLKEEQEDYFKRQLISTPIIIDLYEQYAKAVDKAKGNLIGPIEIKAEAELKLKVKNEEVKKIWDELQATLKFIEAKKTISKEQGITFPDFDSNKESLQAYTTAFDGFVKKGLTPANAWLQFVNKGLKEFEGEGSKAKKVVDDLSKVFNELNADLATVKVRSFIDPSFDTTTANLEARKKAYEDFAKVVATQYDPTNIMASEYMRIQLLGLYKAYKDAEKAQEDMIDANQLDLLNEEAKAYGNLAGKIEVVNFQIQTQEKYLKKLRMTRIDPKKGETPATDEQVKKAVAQLMKFKNELVTLEDTIKINSLEKMFTAFQDGASYIDLLGGKIQALRNQLDILFQAPEENGTSQAVKDITAEIKKLQLLQDVTGALTSSIENFFMINKEGFENFGKYIEDWATSVLRTFQQLLAQLIAEKIVGAIMGGTLNKEEGSGSTEKDAAANAGLALANAGVIASEKAKVAAMISSTIATQAAASAAMDLAIASAIAAGAWVPFPGNIAAIAGGVGAVIAAMTAAKGAMAGMAALNMPGLAEGGQIPPGFPNDTYPALLSSGETVIPLDKIKSQQMSFENVVFEIEGDRLVGILKKQNRKASIY